MNTKHTPGEWVLSKNENTEQIQIHCGNEFRPIAYLNYQKNRGENNHKSQEANARLIAAAPNLLEALTFLLSRLDEFGSIDSVRDEDPIETAKAAILKATTPTDHKQ